MVEQREPPKFNDEDDDLPPAHLAKTRRTIRKSRLLHVFAPSAFSTPSLHFNIYSAGEQIRVLAHFLYILNKSEIALKNPDTTNLS